MARGVALDRFSGPRVLSRRRNSMKGAAWMTLAGLAAVSVAGCDRAADEVGAGVDRAAAVAMTKNPFTEVEPPRDGDKLLRGEIVEILRAGTYTYASVACDDGTTRWVVTMRRGLSVGHRVDVTNMGVRRDFHSKRLDRTFDELVFGVVRPVIDEETKGT
jgi:hypothetical protein